jgi:RNA polymerase sigma factor (sigma-70 family)
VPREIQPYPKNIEEFFEMGFTQNIRFRINAFNLKDALNNPEDLVSDVILALMETKYLDRYSPEKGSFKTYLYGFVDNLLKKRYNKENTRHGKFIVSAASLSTAPPESDAEFNGREVYAELLDTGIDESKQVEVRCIIEAIKEELRAEHKANSSYVHQGITYERDPATVFELMLKDMDTKEIAETLGVSTQFVYHLLKKVRSAPSYRDYMNKK